MTAFSARRDAAIARAYEAGHGPCARCGMPAETEDLSRYGAMCRQCFEAYCLGAPSRPTPRTAAERSAVIRGIVAALAPKRDPGGQVLARLHALRDAGAPMTDAQRHVMRCIERVRGIGAGPSVEVEDELASVANGWGR